MKTQSLMHMIEYFNLKLTENFPDAIYPLVVDAVEMHLVISLLMGFVGCCKYFEASPSAFKSRR